MTPVWGIHESVIRSGTSPEVFVVSGDKNADTGENASGEKRSCFFYVCSIFNITDHGNQEFMSKPASFTRDKYLQELSKRQEPNHPTPQTLKCHDCVNITAKLHQKSLSTLLRQEYTAVLFLMAAVSSWTQKPHKE